MVYDLAEIAYDGREDKIATWLLRKNLYLDNAAPIEFLYEGKIQKLIDEMIDELKHMGKDIPREILE